MLGRRSRLDRLENEEVKERAEVIAGILDEEGALAAILDEGLQEQGVEATNAGIMDLVANLSGVEMKIPDRLENEEVKEGAKAITGILDEEGSLAAILDEWFREQGVDEGDPAGILDEELVLEAATNAGIGGCFLNQQPFIKNTGWSASSPRMSTNAGILDE